MGRHSSVKSRGARSRSPVILLSVLLVLALLGWLTVDFLSQRLGASDCESTTTVRVTAAEDIAPVVDQLADRVAEQEGDACYEVSVTARESSVTADSLVLSDGTERPHVWIPESTIWLQRAQEKGAWNVPVQGTSIASSPVVLALTEEAASRIGWPSDEPTWAEVLGPEARQDLTIGMPDPAREPAGVSTLFGVRDLHGDNAQAITAELRTLSPNTVPRAADLFTRLPGVASSEEPLDGFPASELAVLRHNVRGSGVPLVAVYAQPAVPALDYPYVVLPDTEPAERDAAERFLSELIAQEAAGVLADAGFRTPDGEMLRDRDNDRRTMGRKMTPAPLPEPAQVDQVLNQWAGVNLSARIQVLLDVSGSMNEPVPGTGRNRMAVTLQAAELGIGLMKPTTKLGIWLFSTNLDGENRDHRELVPVRPVSDLQSTGAIERLREVQALPNGATGLYDSTLAAYRSATQNFEPGRINLVIVLTDGRNEDANGISREGLLAELGALQDPRRPVQIIGIGIGPDIDEAELQAIAGATGGQAFTTPDPTKIGDIFYAALSKLLCQPPECQPTEGG
ncbi:substrate-binding and VWA domain-containing protein [Actinophytocola gossypii]|uniref:VWA domain-containing protein n=1 Tax=Actinophytocola gossypii TaxID=2812003 RepID=A0ABT2J4I5_9PSEU|nr:substrate-binding and VWA domain-containing protein [Actinophytocola gossypii]MCT2582780.1 VWA domain-containing protein [Actinophytocola gossypii]